MDRQHVSPRVSALRPYSPGKPIEDVKRELGITGEIVKLASNENPLGPCPSSIQAVQNRLMSSHMYPDAACIDLANVIANKLGVDTNQLLFGNGSDECIHLLGLTFLEEGDEVVTGQPTFVLYEAAATLAGAKRIGVPLTEGDLRHDAKAMVAAFTEKTRLVIIANPHNPTGSIITKSDVDYILEHLPSRAYLVLDEAYVDYIDANSDFPFAIDYIKSGSPVISLRTFSKLYGLAGFRVGYAVAAPDVIASMQKPRSPFNVNILAQTAAIAASGDDAFVVESKNVNADGMSQLTAGAEALGMSVVPSHANFILIDTKRPCREVYDSLLRDGIIVRTGDIFGLPTMLRVTIGTERQNAMFLDALKTAAAMVPSICA
ncbi:MAG: histidinol-phosphate aminotransferase 2 [Armatimonadota bacterium]